MLRTPDCKEKSSRSSCIKYGEGHLLGDLLHEGGGHHLQVQVQDVLCVVVGTDDPVSISDPLWLQLLQVLGGLRAAVLMAIIQPSSN